MDIEPKEDSDLLSKTKRAERNGNLRHEENTGPPDGGIRAYFVVMGSFFTNGLVFGVINSYSVIYTVLEAKLRAQGVLNSESSASLVGSLTFGTTFILSPVSGVLTGILGLRMTAVLGGSIAVVGLFISSFNVHNVYVLYFTYGIMYGVGASLAYTPSLAILGHYFKTNLGKVNGLVTVGSSVFTVFMPALMEYIIKKHGLEWLFRILSLITIGIVLCGLLFKPVLGSGVVVEKPSRQKDGCAALFRSIINVEIYKNKKYLMWALSMPVALFGYFVPYVHIKKFMEENFVGVNYNLPLQSIAITSGIGRLTFGFLADRPGIDKILLQQISFYIIGSLTIILPFVQSFPLLIVIALAMGLFDGAFIALIGPIAFELCASAHAAQAIGCMLGMAATPICVGPAIGGYLYGIYQSYTLPFVLAGISPLVGATMMFLVRFFKSNRSQESISTVHVSLNSTFGNTFGVLQMSIGDGNRFSSSGPFACLLSSCNKK
ncbi:hypothetical protein K1T71_001309 [Dendrolimus kikuchii]|uniref:Uncharacterized protein n=1 Tax=Dendrolimus kikuchii TaxID=765133 RepID=A0ACC1DH82_9NEOP|nr:hypothetical protein K1T71_001309 [Dendrolimus kikuchii]